MNNYRPLSFLSFLSFLAFINPPETLWFTFFLFFLFFSVPKDKFKEYFTYLKDNPEGYWFKAKLYGWGWTPVKWQGWLVVLIGLAIFSLGLYVRETDDSPGATGLGLLIMIVLILTFGYWKGEKPRWQWGPPRDQDKA